MYDPDLQKILNRITATLERDALVQTTTQELRNFLQVDRVVLYYFYREWSGRVTFESLSQNKLSIVGSTGPDDCFNSEYALLYQAGRVRAIADIESEPIQPCHRDFLRGIQVKANLVVPVLNLRRLWGLLIAHQCQSTRSWSQKDIEVMQEGAYTLANSAAIRDS